MFSSSSKPSIFSKFLNNLKYILIFSIVFFFTACSQKDVQIADLKNYSQNPFSYTKDLNIKLQNQDDYLDDYLKNFFLPWNIKELSYTKSEASWGNIYKKKQIYLENHNLAPKEWFEKQTLNSNFNDYNTILKKAITRKNSNLRVFPTKDNMFFNPLKAGEGFPFDYNQNSSIKINTPLLISHYSKDKAWAFVQSHLALGWIRIDNITFVDEDFINKFKTNDYYISIKESFPIFNITKDKNIPFIESIKIGTLFPKMGEKYLIASNSKNGIEKIDIDNYNISKLPLSLTNKNLSLLAREFMGELYSWGGLNNHRDCSSFTQDFFAPFGIYLKRNSKEQTLNHKYIDLSSFNDEEKKEFILNNAIPFLSLVYLKGHIILYIGNKNNEPLVMHNMWGVNTWEFLFKEGRHVVGKTVITTLEPGSELFNANKNKTLLRRIQGIVFLNEKKD